ncbi:hypothetical protein BN59_02559 [Legionella massiliensis]|uniref:YhhN-like protein n=1 Tax=Legionella massiliensis TaxID=1034943 RepID=A0A078L2C5_9GAMM|nr:hypothetical protein [Legionella massiliensis]CDZ78249.1 hypothetical protein BN59_02559 [Legionella massiliensis]CEE13987.1 hypothetical protein BN1094_02559 [Legionella massiliensis]
MVNLNTKDGLFLLSGIIGSCILFLGLSKAPAQLYYVIGSTLLLFAALHFRLIYFIALELILIAGHGASLLHIGKTLQIAMPIMLTVQLLAFYFLSGQLNNIFLLIGIAGIALHSVGFVYENQWIFFFGSLFIAIYAFYAVFRGKTVALLWAVLNTLFTLTAIYALMLS